MLAAGARRRSARGQPASRAAGVAELDHGEVREPAHHVPARARDEWIEALRRAPRARVARACRLSYAGVGKPASSRRCAGGRRRGAPNRVHAVVVDADGARTRLHGRSRLALHPAQRRQAATRPLPAVRDGVVERYDLGGAPRRGLPAAHTRARRAHAAARGRGHRARGASRWADLRPAAACTHRSRQAPPVRSRPPPGRMPTVARAHNCSGNHAPDAVAREHARARPPVRICTPMGRLRPDATRGRGARLRLRARDRGRPPAACRALLAAPCATRPSATSGWAGHGMPEALAEGGPPGSPAPMARGARDGRRAGPRSTRSRTPCRTSVAKNAAHFGVFCCASAQDRARVARLKVEGRLLRGHGDRRAASARSRGPAHWARPSTPGAPTSHPRWATGAPVGVWSPDPPSAIALGAKNPPLTVVFPAVSRRTDSAFR